MTYGCPMAALWLQAFCISILEAVACGLRVVSTKVRGMDRSIDACIDS